MRSTIWTVALCVCLVVALSAGAAFSAVAVVDKPDVSKPNSYYAGHKAPLLPSTLIKLPFGAINPQGWLRKQLELEAAGFTGHLAEISPYISKDCAWLSPEGLGPGYWEEVPYWMRGFSALGYVLKDERIIKETQPYIEAAIANQVDFGYFGSKALLFAPTQPAVPADLLTTPDGKPGLKAEYYSGQDFKTLVTTQVDSQIDFDWGGKSPMTGLGDQDWSARWTGKITVKKTGDYTFSLYSDDGSRVWIDGKPVLELWQVQAPMTTPAAKPVHMEAGKAYDIKVEYFQAGGGSEIRLGWKMPGAVYTPRTGSPDLMPNMSMMYALRANYEYTGDPRIIKLLTNYFKWELSVPDNKFFAGGWQYPRNGDNLDSVHWLYNITGDKFLLELGDKLMRTGHRWMGRVNGGHNVDYSQGFRKPAQYYMQTGDIKYLQATETNYSDMYDVYAQMPGGMFAGDEFARPGHTDPQQAIETCGTADMMMSQEILLEATGDTKWADRCEEITFNTLPASFTPDMKALRYLTSPNQCNSDRRSKAPILADGGPMQWMNPYEHRCCQHNSGMAWPYFAQNTWQATPGNGLAAVFYSPAEVTAKVGDGTKVTITETTQYPFDGKVDLAVKAPRSVAFPLYLRIPKWCVSPKVAVNGKALTFTPKPGAYIMVDRTWANGDKVTIDLPMPIKVRTWTKNKDAISVDRGPLTYSVKIQEDYVRSGGTDKWPAWEIKPASAWNYGLIIDKNNPAKSIEVVKKPWPTSNQPFKWDSSPIELRIKAKKIPNWQENYRGLIDALQQSPVKSSSPVETISLIPMGAGRLRVSAIPVIGDGPDAKPWQVPQDPVASSTHDAFPYTAMTDGQVGKGSGDRTVKTFSWWPNNMGLEWVTQQFTAPKTVSSVGVYWFDDEDACSLPVWWKLYYKDGDSWKPVVNAGKFTTELDKFNMVKFDAVKTTALKIEAMLGGRSGGIVEWKVN